MCKKIISIIKYKIPLLALICISIIFIGWANNWDQVKKAANNINTISAEFIQEKHLDILSRPLISKGNFYYSAINSLRWEYNSPIKSILLMDNGNIKRYVLNTNNKFTLDSTANLKAMAIVLQEITMWLSGRFDQNPDFSAKLKTGRNSIIILTPKNESLSNIIKRIELKLSKKPGIIKSITIYESKRNYTLIKFHNVRLNKVIKKSLYQEI